MKYIIIPIWRVFLLFTFHPFMWVVFFIVSIVIALWHFKHLKEEMISFKELVLGSANEDTSFKIAGQTYYEYKSIKDYILNQKTIKLWNHD